MCTISSAHVTPVLLESGTSGSGTWKYERVDGDTVLTIAPAKGADGTLDSFFWNGSQYKETAKRIAVKGTVKVGSSAYDMFKGFKQTTLIDVAGLDVAGVTNMKEMFCYCFALTSLSVSNWNVSNAADMGSCFMVVPLFPHLT